MSDSEVIRHQLVVIGNGFDLTCGLRSKFWDFYYPRKIELQSCGPASPSGITTNWCKDVIKRRLTAWDIILQDYADCGWCDIESALADWIVRNPARLADLARVINDPNRPEYARYNGPAGQYTEYLLASYVSFVQNPDPGSSYSVSNLVSFLLDELHVIERGFDMYLTGEVRGNTDYQSNASALLSDLVRDAWCFSDLNSDCSVLNFNYTMPWLEDRDDVLPIVYTNIHGRLGGEIVFGIDGKECLGDLNASPFTKTYRLLGLGAPYVGELVHVHENGEELPTELIKFFGHSLGEADYSYFQALFDAVNLYESQTRLIFYYRQHGKKSEADCKRDMMGKVLRLLVEYGKTLDNEDHGKNLVHKLLIEGRLSVSRI